MPDLWVANDHAAFAIKEEVAAQAVALGWTVRDLGTHAGHSVDYPDMAAALAQAYDGADPHRGLLICGSGIGISIAANRHTHLRAALCHDVTSAILSRQHNDANVLCLGARLVGIETAKGALIAFLGTEFEGGRHARRVAKLAKLA